MVNRIVLFRSWAIARNDIFAAVACIIIILAVCLIGEARSRILALAFVMSLCFPAGWCVFRYFLVQSDYRIITDKQRTFVMLASPSCRFFCKRDEYDSHSIEDSALVVAKGSVVYRLEIAPEIKNIMHKLLNEWHRKSDCQ